MQANTTQLMEALRITEQCLSVRSEDDLSETIGWLSRIIEFDTALILNLKLNHSGNAEIASMVPFFGKQELHYCDINEVKSSNLFSQLSTQLQYQTTFNSKCIIPCTGNSLITGIQSPNRSSATAIILMNKNNTDFIIQNQILKFLLPHIDSAINRFIPDQVIDLSSRQLQVLDWISKGKSNWEVGSILNLSENTVKFHVSNICKKLDVHKRSHAVAKATQLKLVNGY